MSEKAFLVDTSKCQGCRACQVACKQWNGLPGEKTDFFAGPEYTNPASLSAITWNRVKFSNLDRSNTATPVWSIMHQKCNHCTEANCLRVCPEKAISKVDGWTVIDQTKCIGCGACVDECVYHVPGISEKTIINDVKQQVVTKDKSHKCTACTVNKRDIPACVNTCPTGALTIGYRADIIKRAKKRVAEIKKDFPNASIYGLEEFGGLGVITILKNKPQKYGLPVNVKPIEMSQVEAVHDLFSLLSIFTFGIPSLKRVAYKIARSVSKVA